MKKFIRLTSIDTISTVPSKGAIQKAVDLILECPFSEFDKMYFTNMKLIDLDTKLAVAKLFEGKEYMAGFENTLNHASFGLTIGNGLNKIVFESQTEKNGFAFNFIDVLSFLKKMRAVFENHNYSWGGCDQLISLEIYDEHDIPSAPPCFSSQLKWAYILSPHGYESYFKKEDLFHIPHTHSVRELENGDIEILFYEHPFDYDKEGAVERIIENTAYLNSKRLDWK